jgi:PIN domain nuclease of toxin-antitoxin system
VSAASAWEIATKIRLGKLPWAAPLLHNFISRVQEQAFDFLDVSVAHALPAGNLPGAHKDPFDRMLIAQALAENLLLISNEAVFDSYGVGRLW